MKNIIRSLIYPGLDLHTRNRKQLCRFWQTGSRDVLDAGSGNGYFSWLAYKSGARVVGLSFEKEQVDKARDFLIGHRRADPLRLRFEHRNLYDLDEENRTFDEIICFEVLEHLGNDEQIVKQFFRILKPGGFLHLCTPNRLHPRNQAEILDSNEKGGHIRAGYTEGDYRRLLEPVGFQVEKVVGIGPHSLYVADTILRVLRNKLGDVAALPFLPLALPFVWFARMNPPVPFSIYVRARK